MWCVQENQGQGTTTNARDEPGEEKKGLDCLFVPQFLLEAKLGQVLWAGVQGQGLGHRKGVAVDSREGTLNPWLG